MQENQRQQLQEVLSLYGIREAFRISEENITYETKVEAHIWTVNDDYILKMSTHEYEMKGNILLAQLLIGAGIPVQKVIQSIDQKGYVCVDNKYFGLFKKIKGDVLKDYFAGDYIARGFYLGECIAELHKGLKEVTEVFKQSKKIWDNNMIDELEGWVSEGIEGYLTRSTLTKCEIEAFEKIYKEVKCNFPPLYVQLPRQLRDIMTAHHLNI